MTQTNTEKQSISQSRRAAAYELAKATAQAEGVPIPRKNFPEDGAAFDAWLHEKLAAVTAKEFEMNDSKFGIFKESDGYVWITPNDCGGEYVTEYDSNGDFVRTAEPWQNFPNDRPLTVDEMESAK